MMKELTQFFLNAFWFKNSSNWLGNFVFYSTCDWLIFTFDTNITIFSSQKGISIKKVTETTKKSRRHVLRT